MEDIFVKIGELIATEIDNVKEVRYLPKSKGYVCVIVLDDGNEISLQLN